MIGRIAKIFNSNCLLVGEFIVFFWGGALQNSANGQNPPKRSKEQMEVVDHLIFEVRSATYILLGLEPSPIPWVLSLEGRNEKPGVASQPSWKITV